MLGSVIPGWKVFSTLLGLGLFLLLAWFVYDEFFAPPDDLTSAEATCLKRLLPGIASDIRSFAEKHNVRGVNVGMFRGDTPNAHIRHSVSDAIRSMDQSGLVLKREPFTKSLYRSITGEDADFDVKTRDEARKYVAEKEGIGFVIYGRAELARYEDQAEVGIELYLQGATPEASFHHEYYTNTWDFRGEPDEEGFELSGATGWGFGDVAWRVLVFIIVAFFLPIATGPLAVYGFRLESNAVNFGILALYTLLTGLLAWSLVGFALNGWIAVLLLVAMTAGGLWNYRVCSVWESRA